MILKFFAAIYFWDDDFDVAKFTAGAKSRAEREASGDLHVARREDVRCRCTRESCRGPVCGVSFVSVLVPFARLLLHNFDIEALQDSSNI